MPRRSQLRTLRSQAWSAFAVSRTVRNWGISSFGVLRRAAAFNRLSISVDKGEVSGRGLEAVVLGAGFCCMDGFPFPLPNTERHKASNVFLGSCRRATGGAHDKGGSSSHRTYNGPENLPASGEHRQSAGNELPILYSSRWFRSIPLQRREYPERLEKALRG